MFVLVIQDHESYSPEAWGPFTTADAAEDYIDQLDPVPAAEDCQIAPLHSAND